jgi:hypothetical protein
MSQSIRQPWSKQPQTAVLDRGNSLTNGLTFASVGGRDLVSGVLPSGSSGQRGRPDGRFATFDGSTQSLVYATGELFNTADPGITIMMRTVQTSTPVYSTLARFRFNNSAGFIIFSTTDSGYFRYAFGSTTTGPANKFGPASARAINSVDTIALRYDNISGTGFGSNNAWTGFENGTFFTSSTNSGLIPPTLETRLADDTSFPGEIHYCYVWRRRLSDAEIQSLYLNPWQMFTPQPRRILWMPEPVIGGLQRVPVYHRRKVFFPS